jgi:DMSO/TMAO reductase YedYZ molybdopterin-dependent catalytic subunit
MMTVTRRDAIRISGGTLAGLSLGAKLSPEELAAAEAALQSQEWPETLVEVETRAGFPVDLPLEADGSAPTHPASAAGPIEGRLMWRTEDRPAPPGEYDYRQMRIRVDTRRLARLSGTLRFEDLERLPEVSQTFLLQCGAPEPRGVVKWTGVRFSDFVDMLGLVEGARENGYVRFVGTDNHYVDESVRELMSPQVMLAWRMNDEPISPAHGAPLRLIVPFRYGNRSLKAITQIVFAVPGLPPWNPTA